MIQKILFKNMGILLNVNIFYFGIVFSKSFLNVFELKIDVVFLNDSKREN